MRVFGTVRSQGRDMGPTPVGYYRVALPLRALDAYTKHDAVTYDQYGLENLFKLAIANGKSPDDAIKGYDVYVLSRLYRDHGAQEFIDFIHDNGGVVIMDTDDDLSEEHRILDGRGEEFVNQVRRVDLVTVSTPYLAKRMGRYSKKDPVVLPNHLDFGWFRKSSLNREKQTKGLTVGVVGTKTHYDDWLYLRDVFPRLERKYDVTVVTAGFQPDYLEGFEHIEGVPYKVYPQMIREFDIVCCALDTEDGFNKSKSSIKALEAMASARRLSNGKIGGAVAVCTDMTLYRRTVNHMHNGMLINNGDWYQALSMLIEDESTRNQLAYRGHRWVRDNRDIRRGYRKWKKTYLSLLEDYHGA